MPTTPQQKATMFLEDERKFTELLLYIAVQSDDDPHFASTKLNKLLFACDLFAYGTTGKPITGLRYAKRQYGPAPRKLTTIRERMITNGELAIRELPSGSHTQQRPIPLRAPDLSVFSGEEIAIVNDVLNVFRRTTARQISEWSHGLCGWAIARDGADIPYEVVFLSDQPITAYEAEHGRQLALERGWDVF